ncbi:MAG: UpxY family transcription antiterminator [Bryobacteraceae bacterium]|nr:UpxY family transcription antiterminator [Bryobacteraceae bacterium]
MLSSNPIVTTGDPLHWFALQVRPRFERIASRTLHDKGYEEFTPFYTTTRKWSDRRKEVEFPLFPGYVFCRFDPLYRLPLLKTTGVVSVVGFGRGPAPIDDGEIAGLRTLLANDRHAIPWPYLRVGQKVRVVGGPLHGVEGLLQDLKTGRRIVLSVNLLQRSVAAEIDREHVEPLL